MRETWDCIVKENEPALSNWDFVVRDLTLGGEHMMQYSDDELWNCTLETCMVLLTNVTPINLIRKK